MNNLESELQAVKDLARQDKHLEALKGLDEIEKAFPDEARVWATRAYVNGHSGSRDHAVSDWTKAIALCDREPHYFYIRGIEFFHLGRFREAVADFTKVIELCDFYDSDYYRAPAHFFRADTYLKLGRFEEAKADCAHFPDDMRTWTDRIRTKADILTQCAA